MAEIAVVPEGWRTMESAPRDGTRVLLAGKDIYGANDPGGPRWRIDFGWYEPKGGTLREGWVGLGTHYPPTHWMPYPKPPTDTRRRGASG